jgi:phosphoribosylamine--glycine ligase
LDGTLATQKPVWAQGSAVCVIAASGGYPGEYSVGKPISGLNEVGRDAIVFHAGTRRDGDELVSAGGRVLGVATVGDSLAQARESAYAALAKVSFEGMHFRRDIGLKGLQDS